jgi:hypothetical protein
MVGTENKKIAISFDFARIGSAVAPLRTSAGVRSVREIRMSS